MFLIPALSLYSGHVPYFILNERPQDESGHHEVHSFVQGLKNGCLPYYENWIYLFDHPSCTEAVIRARAAYPNWSINGCAKCAPDCDEG